MGDVNKKEIESFLGLVLLMSINDLSKIKVYWSKDVMFYNTLISSTISRDRFLETFYNLNLANNSLKPKQEL